LISIKIGDQIIEVDNQSLVGVTHTHATNVLKATSGVVKYD
jgi:C-terminal processing protease CtpA/Prc